MSTLHEASHDGDKGRVKKLLDGGVPVDEKDEGGKTALMLASEKGRTEVVRLLLDKGALLDEKDADGMTALMWASNEGHTEVVKLLLNRGASVDVKDKYGSTALATVIAFDEDQLGAWRRPKSTGCCRKNRAEA